MCDDQLFCTRDKACHVTASRYFEYWLTFWLGSLWERQHLVSERNVGILYDGSQSTRLRVGSLLIGEERMVLKCFTSGMRTTAKILRKLHHEQALFEVSRPAASHASKLGLSVFEGLQYL